MTPHPQNVYEAAQGRVGLDTVSKRGRVGPDTFSCPTIYMHLDTSSNERPARPHDIPYAITSWGVA